MIMSSLNREPNYNTDQMLIDFTNHITLTINSGGSVLIPR